jgi:8-oxo-dGTP diphosphatase
VIAGRSVAAILVKDGKVFTARRGPGGALGGKWEFPGGKVEPGESDEAALVRELDEELGARVRVGELLAEEDFAHRGAKRILSAYLVELEPDSGIVPAEHVELRWSSPGELAGLDLVDSDRKLLPAVERLLGRSAR